MNIDIDAIEADGAAPDIHIEENGDLKIVFYYPGATLTVKIKKHQAKDLCNKLMVNFGKFPIDNLFTIDDIAKDMNLRPAIVRHHVNKFQPPTTVFHGIKLYSGAVVEGIKKQVRRRAKNTWQDYNGEPIKTVED